MPRSRPSRTTASALRLTALALLFAAIAAPALYGAVTADPTRTPAAGSVAAGFPTTPGPSVAELLAALPTDGPAPTTGYDRDLFPHWSDLDGNGCDQRDDTLERDMTGGEYGPDGCIDAVVITDPYSGARIDGRTNIDIDHVVPLSWAWRNGAAHWTTDQRERFANDSIGLLAVDDGLNAGKGDSPPSQWLPPDPAAWCDYGRRWVVMLDRYQLPATPTEAPVLADLVSRCATVG